MGSHKIHTLAFEKKNNFHSSEELTLDGESKAVVLYQIKLLYEAGLIDAIDASSKSGPGYFVDCLTWQGHEFLDAIRDETIWSKVKGKLSSFGGTLPFDIILQLATDAAKQLLSSN